MPNHSEPLMEVAGETLEQLAFMFSFPDDMDPDAIWAADVVGAQVGFDGPVTGNLLLAISSAALPELTANMLGLDEDAAIPEDQQKDALKEALNVICGNLLPRIGGVEAVFDIRPPVILDTDTVRQKVAAARENPGAWSSALLSLDEGACQLYLRTNAAA